MTSLERCLFPSFCVFIGEKHYGKSFPMALVCNLPGHIALFPFGSIRIGIVMIAIQPFIQGAVIGMEDKRPGLMGASSLYLR
ncbi:hypothetical protein [Anaeromassilibacillus senegalensis]|uniref:hypothetical protein n=1 Tax=Anaeromassilibacillus senegalensis TaxID=1673717 RepID=UPI0012B61A3C|nr:hypothetical protein [Anaeromassilibacillus senegalensis]